MPVEQRSLIFNNEEFLAAVMAYGRKRGGKEYGVADIRGVGVEGKDDSATVLTMTDGAHLHFSESDLLAALIAHCIEDGIPLPARASKWLRNTEDGMELVIAEWERRLRTSSANSDMIAD